MNIYITPQNEKRLRTLDVSMSGLVNLLLDQHFQGSGDSAHHVTPLKAPADEDIDVAKPFISNGKIIHGPDMSQL